ncbi:MAG: hypothetical protein Q4B67_08485 [Eubacteriales bacterium]|nr:hypothetical protein [Eubacteriales bacterium]
MNENKESNGKKEMCRERKLAILYYCISAVSYICSVMFFVQRNAGLGALWLCIGSTNLCLGSTWINKARTKETDEKK